MSHQRTIKIAFFSLLTLIIGSTLACVVPPLGLGPAFRPRRHSPKPATQESSEKIQPASPIPPIAPTAVSSAANPSLAMPSTAVSSDTIPPNLKRPQSPQSVQAPQGIQLHLRDPLPQEPISFDREGQVQQQMRLQPLHQNSKLLDPLELRPIQDFQGLQSLQSVQGLSANSIGCQPPVQQGRTNDIGPRQDQTVQRLGIVSTEIRSLEPFHREEPWEIALPSQRFQTDPLQPPSQFSKDFEPITWQALVDNPTLQRPQDLLMDVPRLIPNSPWLLPKVWAIPTRILSLQDGLPLGPVDSF